MRFLSASSRGERVASSFLDRWFPMPQFLMPHASGIDISDASIKWLTLTPKNNGFQKVLAWGEVSLPPGVVTGGIVRDGGALASALKEIRPHHGGVRAAHAALPEETAYVFGMHVPERTDREQILRMIEFEFNDRVPIPPSAAIYDFGVIQEHGDAEGEGIGVTVFPRDQAEQYAQAFEQAGITLLSLELEARSIARAALSSDPEEPITLLVDFGRARTGFAVVKCGVPIFTSTVDVGGDALSAALTKATPIHENEIEAFKNNEGLVPSDESKKAGSEAMAGAASALSDEVARHFHYWDTRRNDRGERVTPVGKVVLVGGSANLNGLPEYIAGRIQARVERANIWKHVCSFDDYIPPIDFHASMQYATAVGLALR